MKPGRLELRTHLGRFQDAVFQDAVFQDAVFQEEVGNAVRIVAEIAISFAWVGPMICEKLSVGRPRGICCLGGSERAEDEWWTALGVAS